MERAAYTRSDNCGSCSCSSCVCMRVRFVRLCVRAARFKCRAVTVSPCSSYVCSFRASFQLGVRAACFELLAVLHVTLQFVAAAFIPSPLWRNNAQ
uniref:Uncharacterized protein n=1 Tax=Rhipicephalus zambeziensis TaxID=60191 RepID=A0A224YFG4_9ACAR